MSKETTVTFRVEPELRAAFQQAADSTHRPAAQVLRELMRFYIQQTAKQKPAISEAEKHRRQEAVDYARATLALEGFEGNAAYGLEAARWVRGEIDSDELTAKAHAIAQNLLNAERNG